MEPVTLLRCGRCGLQWVQDTEMIPGWCPSCHRSSGIPTEVTVMGRDVRVRLIREYGLRVGLCDPKVRKRLANLDLGYCKHGYITPAICPDCR